MMPWCAYNQYTPEAWVKCGETGQQYWSLSTRDNKSASTDRSCAYGSNAMAALEKGSLASHPSKCKLTKIWRTLPPPSRNLWISFLTVQAREAWGGTLASLNPKWSRSLRHFPAWNKLLFKVQCPVNMRLWRMQNPQTHYPPKRETFSAIFPAMPIHLQIPKFWSGKSARCHQGTHHPNNPPQQRGSVLHPQLERQIPRCLTDSAGTTINISALLSIARISSTKCLPKKLVWFWGILRGRSPTHQRLTNASLPFVIHHNTTPLNTDQTAQATTVECHISWQCEHKTFAISYMMSRDRSIDLGRNSNIVHTHTMFFGLGDHICNPQREV